MTDGAPLPLRIERALVAAVVVFSGLLWWTDVRERVAAPAPADADTLQRLPQLLEEGRGRPAAALVGLLTLASFAALGHLLSRAARGLRVALAGQPLSMGAVLAAARAWWAERTRGLRADLTIGHFLLAFGLTTLAPLPVALLLPSGRLVSDAGEVEVGVRAPHRVEHAGVRVTFSPDMGSLRAQVEGGAIQVDGRPAGPGRVHLRDGAVAAVGSTTWTVRAPDPVAQVGAGALGQVLAVAALLALVLYAGGREGLARLGLTTAGLGREALRGARGWLAVLPLYFLVLTLWTHVAGALGEPREGHALVELLEREGPRLALLVVLQAVVLAPLLEELLYRGLLVPAVARVTGLTAGVLVASVIFGLRHPGFMSLLPITTIGLLFTALYVTSPHRSLVGSIVAHALFNGAQLLLVILVQLA